MTARIDSIFISHGAPTYALEPGLPGMALNRVGRQLTMQGTALLIVLSPHWRSAQLAISSHAAPVIVHDFHGFPPHLYSLKPEVQGSPELAALLAAALEEKLGKPVQLRPQQGFDHGAWVPYLHLFPEGGPPMVQLSMPVDWTGEDALRAGQVVGEFARQNKAVVVGSGSLTHNFADMQLESPADAVQTPPTYVADFKNWIAARLGEGDLNAIAGAARLAPHFMQAHPDDDHYLPLPFAMGAARAGAEVEALPEEIRYRALSMQSYVFRQAAPAPL